ncbi:MAG: DNA sulfur modification protein DndB [archaeon]|nr:DNA sulfur modification protein DndB [archaeon]
MKTYVTSAWDTLKDSLPEYMSPELFMMATDILEQFDIKEAIDGFLAPINVRIGTEGLKMRQLAIECTKRGLVMEEVLTWPELDTYIYENGENWVCSALVAKVYKEAGVLTGEINPKEFIPRDIYQMKIFDENFINTRPEVCKEAEPDVNWCQIMGKYRKTPFGYNSIPIYDHMNERCPMRAPTYFRPDGC